MAIHYIVPLHATQSAEREIWNEVWEGTQEECLAKASEFKVGTPIVLPTGVDAESVWQDYQNPAINTGMTFQRKAGGLAELSHTYMYVLKREMWSLDMAEISKDIRTWLVLQLGEVAAAPELAKIAQWQALKDNGDFEAWAAFQYDLQGHTLADDTLTLAQKMIKGVDSYTIYAPVLTRTTLWSHMPDSVGEVGVIETPAVRDGWEIIGAQSLDAWTGLANMWLKTASRSTPNQDGTYSLIEQWTGADEIDGDLYADAGGGVGE